MFLLSIKLPPFDLNDIVRNNNNNWYDVDQNMTKTSTAAVLIFLFINKWNKCHLNWLPSTLLCTKSYSSVTVLTKYRYLLQHFLLIQQRRLLACIISTITVIHIILVATIAEHKSTSNTRQSNNGIRQRALHQMYHLNFRENHHSCYLDVP